MMGTDEGTSSMPLPEYIEKAELIKNEANKLFSEKKYRDAIDKYTEAIFYNPNVAAYYGNRAFAYIKVEYYGYALEDATRALEIDPAYVKAYYRRGSAHMGLSKFKESLKDFKEVVKRAPNDLDGRKKYQEVEKIVRRIEFEKAIEVEEEERVISKGIHPENMVVEDSYDGPRLEEDGKVTLDFVLKMMDRFKKQKMIHKRYAFQLILKAKEIFCSLESLVDIRIPDDGFITVCGDVHGQFYDLCNIFELNGIPSDKHLYLFNGDFVDRGSFSLEVILTLFGFKCLYPNSFFMSRGNHETNNMNRIYGFQGEVTSKYNEMMFHLFAETFNAIPLANCINNKILVLHGGLFSRDDVSLDDIRKINRFRQPGDSGLMCELLWSDPQPAPGRSPSKRGVGLQFGPDVTANFLNRNGLDLLIRSHEVKDEGYVIEHDGKCITVFSAPNYCDTINNKAAYINIRPDLKLDIKTFKEVPHPSCRPMQYASQFASLGLL